MVVSIFNAPIPGQSLTSGKPGSRPYERAPELNTVEEALAFYMQKLSDQEVIDDFMILLESGAPIKPVVESLYMSGVMRGKHNLDIGLLVALPLMEFFAAVADSYGINYKFTNRNVKKEMEDRERARMSLLIGSAIEKAKQEGVEDEGTSILEQMSTYLSADMTREETKVGKDAAEEEGVPTEAPPEAANLQGVPEEASPEDTPVEPPAEMQPPSQGQGLMGRGQ